MVQIARNAAKAEFDAIIERVRHGETVELVENGIVVARWLPPERTKSDERTILDVEDDSEPTMSREEAVQAWKRLRAVKPMTVDELIELIHESRR